MARRTRHASELAGDRAIGLNAFVQAAAHYTRALELADDDRAPGLLLKRAQALFTVGDAATIEALERARDALLTSGDPTGAAEAEALLGRLLWLRGSLNEVFPHLDAAESLVEDEEPSLGVARVLSWSARQLMLAGERERSLTQARDALELAERLGLDEIRIQALTTIGSAKEFLGDTSGRDDLWEAVAIARAINSPLVAGALNNLTVPLDSFDLPQTHALAREAVEQAERFGDTEMARFLRGNLAVSAWLLGRWDDAMELADAFVAECEAGSPHILEGPTRLIRGCIQLARGNREPELPDFERALGLAREMRRDPQGMVPALVRNAWARLRIGDDTEARALFAEAMPLLEQDPYARPWMLPELAFELGETRDVRDIMLRVVPSPGRDAMLAVLDGDFEAAARHYGEAGILLFEAESYLRYAEQLFAAGHANEGNATLDRALAFYRPIGAALFVDRAEALLAREATG